MCDENYQALSLTFSAGLTERLHIVEEMEQ